MKPDEMTQGLHLPVLLHEAVAGLAIRPDGVYVDGTFGRGGHSRQILAALGPEGRLLALDRDPEAVAAGQAWARESADARFGIVHARFSALDRVLDEHGVGRIDGLLLDLGISSPQVDDPRRGFSFSGDGPLDMRMDPTEGVSAHEWLMQASVEQITEVLKRDGDERFAFPIAKEIAARRDQNSAKNPATRTFQALRIHTNDEGGELARVLNIALSRLKPSGRLAVISFHSNEDRVVKQFIARHAGRDAERHPVTGAWLAEPLMKSVGRWLPGEAEQAVNPRARSAILRVAERLPAAVH